MNARATLVPAVVLLGLVATDCAGAREAGQVTDGSETYRGLTLEEWTEIPWSGEALLADGTGTVRLERNVSRTIPALQAFAARSAEALERLRVLGMDLDEDVREEAGDALAELAFSGEPNHGAALAYAAQRRMVRDSLRAGITSDTSGASGGGSAGSSSSERESRARTTVTIGPRTHGAASRSGARSGTCAS